MTESTMRILLVEDNIDHRALMTHALTRHEPTWQVQGVVTGEESLRRLAQETFDLVFLDYSLPGENGLEVLQAMRQGQGPPVVVVTGWGNEQVAVAALQAGAYDYVVKQAGYLHRLPVVARRAVEAHQAMVARQRAEEALCQSDEWFRQLAETTSTGILVFQGERFLYVNSACERIAGYTKEAFLSMRFWDVIHPDFQGLVRQRGLTRQRGDPVPTQYEVKLVRQDGSERWIDYSASSIMWGGQPAIIGTAVDITERKQAEISLARYATQLSGLATAVRQLHAADSLAELLQLVTNQAREIIGAHQAFTSILTHRDWAEAVNVASLSDKYAAWRNYAEVPDGAGIYHLVGEQNCVLRLHAASAHTAQGATCGLLGIRERVELLRGQVSIASEPGQGISSRRISPCGSWEKRSMYEPY